MEGPSLPIELIVIIGEFLAGSHALKSLASLNVANREVHVELLHILDETLVWDTDVAWWILYKGHTARGWKFTKYLITMSDTLQRLDFYFKAIAGKNKVDYGHHMDFKKTFPKLAMVITKAIPNTSSKQFDMHHIYIDVSITLHRPVDMHTLLTAPVTSNTASETIFFGANVFPPAPHHGPRYCERITNVTLGKKAYIGMPPRPFVFPPQSKAVHQHDPDFRILTQLPRYHAFDDYDGHGHPPQQANETFKALLSAVPPRKQGVDLCHLAVRCTDNEADELCKVAARSLKDHVRIAVTLDLGLHDLRRLQTPMIALAEQYVTAWDRLGPIGTSKEFFRIEFTDFADDERSLHSFDDDDEDEFDRPRTEYMNIASLKTLPAPPNNASRSRAQSKQQTPEGFELVLKKVVFEDDDDWDEEEEEPEILFRKTYLTR